MGERPFRFLASWMLHDNKFQSMEEGNGEGSCGFAEGILCEINRFK